MAMAVLMLIGGMELEFEGRGCVMLSLTFWPLIAEVIGCTIGCVFLCDMDLSFGISVGFVLGAVSPEY